MEVTFRIRQFYVIAYAFFNLTITGCASNYDKNNIVVDSAGKRFDSQSKLDSQSAQRQIKFYPNGKKESEGTIKDGKKNGVAKLFYENGQLKEKGMWVNDKQEGLWEFFDEKGVLSAQINFENDLQHGLSIFYYTNGQMSEKTNWKNGKLDGESVEYYSNGSIKRKTEWKNHKKIKEEKFDESANSTSSTDTSR